MSAARMDIELEEHSDLTFEFVYKDEDGNANDLTNYGAAIVLSESEKKDPFYIGYASDSDNPILVGGTNGLIEVQVPYTHFHNMDLERGVWELYIFPTAGDITDRPKRLIRGEFVYVHTLLSNNV